MLKETAGSSSTQQTHPLFAAAAGPIAPPLYLKDNQGNAIEVLGSSNADLVCF